jgi:hypothetical protein
LSADAAYRWALIQAAEGRRAACNMAPQAARDRNWVVWLEPDGPNRCWVDPSPEPQRWLGWQMRHPAMILRRIFLRCVQMLNTIQADLSTCVNR